MVYYNINKFLTNHTIKLDINDRTDIFRVNAVNGRERRRRSRINKIRKDNMIIKIQVHFLNFVIYFCNDALKTEFKHSLYSFKKINYRNSSSINSNYIFKLKNSKIKDILNFEINYGLNIINIIQIKYNNIKL